MLIRKRDLKRNGKEENEFVFCLFSCEMIVVLNNYVKRKIERDSCEKEEICFCENNYSLLQKKEETMDVQKTNVFM